MLRPWIASLLCVLLPLQVMGATQPPPTVQEALAEIPKGAIIEVKTTLQDMKTVRGRLGAVTSEGFEVQATQGAKIESVNLKFADVKKVSEKRGSGTRPWVWVLAGIGITFAVLIAIAASVDD